MRIRLQVLHLVRDSRAVAFSWMRQRVRPHVVDQVSYMPIYSPQKSALDWNYRNLLSGLVQKRVATYAMMRYEDFMAEPRQNLEQLTRYFGLGDF
ncbi:MAG: sulfotransferase domain-containing protein [Chloroflexota bacterium]